MTKFVNASDKLLSGPISQPPPKPFLNPNDLALLQEKFNIVLWSPSNPITNNHGWENWVYDPYLECIRADCSACGKQYRLSLNTLQVVKDTEELGYLCTSVIKAFGECEVLFPSEPKEWESPLTDDEIERICEWMNDETKWQQTVLYIARIKRVTWSALLDIDIPDDVVHAIEIRRHRLQVNDRWWLDIATRTDTGEPVATVNHQGDFDEFRHEQEGNKGI